MPNLHGDDSDGPLAVEELYKYLFGRGNKPDFKDAASALNEATRAMRRKKCLYTGDWCLGENVQAGGMYLAVVVQTNK
ncbi:hypothetical protein K439DRAFT_386017 [Ramaria rubella]|nr:hypothetical protein K439DRAFT_386017 [Ramaria rubella]